MGQVVDSSVLIALERAGRNVDFLKRHLEDGPLVIAAVTASELLVGVHRAGTPERRKQRQSFVEELFERLPLLSFDLIVARTYARLLAQLTAVGGLVNAHDLQIAATALTHGYPVLTYNVRHFQKVPGLIVRQPDW